MYKMPVVVELRLRANWKLEPTTRQLHGLACVVFEGAEFSGHSGQFKPFSIWPLSRDDNGAGGQREGWLLRAAWLGQELPTSALEACGQLRLGHVTCTVTDLTYRAVTHVELAAGPPIRWVTIDLHSPTYFSENGTDVVTPDPRLVVGSWRRRWNASLSAGSPLEIDDDAWRDLHRGLRMTAFDLETQQMDSGRGRNRTGFTGTLTLGLDSSAVGGTGRRFATLAKFAEFSGTGAQTTHGFGATSTRLGTGGHSEG
jgi:CRISPR-associated endoribonuclease Cas6